MPQFRTEGSSLSTQKISPPCSASFWRRGAAWGYDVGLFAPMFVLAYLLLPWMLALVATLGLMVMYFVYHAWMEWRFGTTVGKYLVGIGVEKSTGEALLLHDVVARLAGCVLSWATCNVGHALGVWRKDKKMLHDLLTATTVVHKDMVFDHAPYLTASHHRLLTGLSLFFQSLFLVALTWWCVRLVFNVVSQMGMYEQF